MEYTIYELNHLLSANFQNIVTQYRTIKLKGDIIHIKMFKNNIGCSFILKDKDGSQINCKALASNICIKNI